MVMDRIVSSIRVNVKIPPDDCSDTVFPVFVEHRSANYCHGPDLSGCQLSAATHIHLCIFCGCSCATAASGAVATKTLWPT